MGLNFRKSFGCKGFKINLSKKGGIGISTGVKGARISVNKQGVRTSIGKNGLYYRKQHGCNTKANGNSNVENSFAKESIKLNNAYWNKRRDAILKPYGLEGYPLTKKEKLNNLAPWLLMPLVILSVFIGPLGLLIDIFMLILVFRKLFGWKKDVIKWVLEDNKKRNLE